MPWDALFQDSRSPRRAAKRVAAVPRPRPAGAPAAAAEPAKPTEAASHSDPVAATPPIPEPRPAEAAAKSEPPPPSACRLALTDAVAIAPSIADIKGDGGCGGDDLVRLEAIVLADHSRVAVKPAAILRCTMASALADWVRSDLAPLAASLDTTLSNLDNFDSYECRGRNRVKGAKLSEHGRANAIDVRGLKLGNGQTISLTDRGVSRELRESVLQSVCARFTTVLGPGSDWYHEDHIHLDLALRRGDYRICQWHVWDPLPQVAPLLPADRPEQAPPREKVAVREATKEAAEPAAKPAGPQQAEPDDIDPADMERPADPPATKKRRINRRF
ncbi:extensin family protein [Rhodopseudomonas sp.]|uniref:extensin family protein n=1 Tax=Rhodopseudomonas sp. TaxID=1078 RepID=UPI0025F786CA|nr:extensin family protein [Rhodopseudomonas sp.]